MKYFYFQFLKFDSQTLQDFTGKDWSQVSTAINSYEQSKFSQANSISSGCYMYNQYVFFSNLHQCVPTVRHLSLSFHLNWFGWHVQGTCCLLDEKIKIKLLFEKVLNYIQICHTILNY